MAEGVEIPITATGGSAAAAEILKPKKALDDLGKSTDSAASKAQKLSAGLGAFGGALGQIDPLLGQFGASIGRAGGAIGAMTSLIGGGPGIAFGGAVAVIGLLASAWRDSVSDAEAAAKSADQLTKRLEDQATAAKNAATAQRELLREQRATRRRENDAYLSPEEAAYQSQLGDAEAGLARDRATFEKTLGMYQALGTPGAAVGGGGGGRRNARLDAALGEGRGGTASQSEVDAIMFDLGGDQGLDQFLSQAAGRGFGEGRATIGGKGSHGVGDMKDSAIADAEAVKAAWVDAGMSIGGAFAEGFAALVTGSEKSAAAVLSNIGDQMVAEGSRAVFSGLFQTALGNPLGPTMIGIGAGEIAFGLGLGAVVQGASGSAAGGGGRPTPQTRSDARDNNGPSVVNVYALNPTREAGRSIEQSVRAAQRKRVN